MKNNPSNGFFFPLLYPALKSIAAIYTGIILVNYPASGQSIDSLNRLIIEKDITDTLRIDALAQLSRDLTFIDPVRAAKYADEVLHSSLKMDYPKGMANGYRVLASIYSSQDKAIIAEEYLLRAMTIFSKLNDSAGLANCHVTRGHIYRRMGMPKEEIMHHRQAFEIFSRLKIPARIAVTAHNLGESYYNNGDYSKSRELTLYAIRLNDSLNNLPVLSNCYKVMGKLEKNAGNWNEAEADFKKVLSITETLGPYSQKIAAVESMIELAALYKREGNTGLSLVYLKDAAVFCDSNKLAAYLRGVYSELIRYHADQPEKVQHFVNEYNAASLSVADRLQKDEREIQQYGIQVYRFLEAEQRMTEKQLILQEHKMENKSRWLTAAIIAAFTLAALLILLLQTLRRQRKAETALTDKSAKLRELAAHLQNLREEERTRIASEIHERLGQQLIVLKMDVDWLRDKLGQATEKEKKRVEEINNLLKNAVVTIREIATGLRPGVLDDIGLNTAIKWQLAEFEKQYGIKTDFRGPGSDERFSAELKTGLFRILQEALSNTGRHSRAKKMEVQLQLKENSALLTITDDGVGFDPGSAEAKKKFGILSMQERCYMIGGDFEVQSAPDMGTTLIIRAPLPNETS